jgi:Protein of unknown function DUF262
MAEDVFDGIEEESEAGEFPEEITRPFDPSKIKVNRKIIPINLIVERIGHKEIDLSPDFQRRARVWDASRKSRLIESIMLRIPLPVFYVAADADENWRVVDGLQRLTTISDYIAGAKEHIFPLRGLEYLTEYEGAYFEKLPRSIIRRINETELNINVIENGTPDEVMFNIFRRLNTGGMSLNSQEIRNALHPGPVRNFLIELSESSDFQRATAHSVNDNRMGARELSLRFCAFYLSDFLSFSEGDLDGFLNQTMDTINMFGDSERSDLKEIFTRSMSRCWMIFDDNAFRKSLPLSNRRSPINRALFEAVAVSVAKLSTKKFDNLMQKRIIFLDNFYNLLSDEHFVRSISLSTASRWAVHARFEFINSVLKETLDD